MLSKLFGKGKDFQEEKRRIDEELEILEKEKRIKELKIEKHKKEIEVKIDKNIIENITELKKKIRALEFENIEAQNRIKELVVELETKKNIPLPVQAPTPVVESDTVHKIQGKQMDIFEKNLRDLKKENEALKERMEKVKNSNIYGRFQLELHTYKVSIEKAFQNIKAPEIIELLHGKNIKYINDLTFEILKEIPSDTKAFIDIEKTYRDFIHGSMDMDVRLMAIKGERINKLYSKYRKLYQFFNEKHLEFISDLDGYDFYKLVEEGFKIDQIKEFVSKKNEYESEAKIVREKKD